MKLLRIVLYILTVVSFAASGHAKSIKMAKANWDTGYFQAEVYKMGLEKLGYKVKKPQAIKPSVFYLAAASGDADLWVNGWESTHQTYLKDKNVKGKVKAVGYVMKKGG